MLWVLITNINCWFFSIFFNQVEKSSTSALHRTPDPSTFPSSPSEPKAINITNNSIVLSWNKIQPKSGSMLIGYTVEYFSSDLQSGWVLAAHRVPSNTITVRLKYLFVVKSADIFMIISLLLISNKRCN